MRRALDKVSLLFLLLFLGGGCMKFPEWTQRAGRTTDVTYRFEGGADMAEIFSFWASYVDADGSQQALTNVRCILPRLLPELARPFEERIGAVVPPAENQVTLVGMKRYQQQYDNYDLKLSVRIPSSEE